MIVKFNKVCYDKYTGEKYAKGQKITVSDERGKEMLLKPFVEKVKEPRKTTKKKSE